MCLLSPTTAVAGECIGDNLIAANSSMSPPLILWLWVIPDKQDKSGTPLAAGQAPDSLKDELEFRDVCGETTDLF